MRGDHPTEAAETRVGTFPESSDSEAMPQVGARVGRYVLLRELGRGAMGVVYEALDPELDRRVAIKLVGDHGEALAQQRLQREARAMAKVRHPNVVAIHDVGTSEGRVFIAMELVEGGDLREWIASGSHRWQDVVQAFAQAGRGLAAAHAAGIVHRDFKPANALRATDGRVVVTDFGLARPPGADEATPEVALTRPGGVAGTPQYMAPEQGDPGGPDARMDQFSYCVALHEALYGVRPFAGATWMEIGAHAMLGRLHEPTDTRGVPRWLRNIVVRGLAGTPAARWPNMVALVDAIEHRMRRRRVGRIAAGLAAAAVLGVTVVAMRGAGQDACARVAEPLGDTWNRRRADAVEAAFGATGRSYAGESAQRVITAFDRWTTQWEDARVATCELARADRDADAKAHRELACLAQQRLDLGAAVDLLLEVDANSLDDAVSAVTALPAPGRCVGASARLVDEIDVENAELRAELRRLTALNVSGRTRDALALVDALRVDVEASGSAVLSVVFALEEGRASSSANLWPRADQAFRRAAMSAYRVGADDLVLQAAAELVRVAGVHQRETAAAEVWLALAAAALERVGASGGPPAIDLALATGGYAYAMGRFDDAQQSFTTALEESERFYGPGHPSHATIINNLGAVAGTRGDLTAARAAFELALELMKQIMPPSHPAMARAEGNLAVSYAATGDGELALEVLMRVLQQQREVGGESSGAYMEVLAALADVHRDLGQFDRAVERRRQLVALLEAANGPGHPVLAAPLGELGRDLSNVGAASDARSILARAVTILDADPDAHDPVSAASIRFALAKALVATGGDLAAARALAEQAAAESKAHGDMNSALGTEIDLWISARFPG